ncbi:MAG: hypothetical protein ACKVU1_17535 [bacterium]
MLGKYGFIKRHYRGLFNRYQRGLPVVKYIFEDARALGSVAWHFVRGGFRLKTIVVFPHFPSRRSSIYRIAGALGCYVTNRRSFGAARALVYWEYLTFREEAAAARTRAEQLGCRIINAESLDISKRFVDEHFAAVFGYSTFVDPMTHTGPCVEKGDVNALHDGRVIDAPVAAPDPSKVYQIVIDNQHDARLVMDLRVPVFLGEIPFVFVKYRPLGERFKNTTVRTTLAETAEVFSSDERAKLAEFCALVKLEFGELDVLRDRRSGRIYVVDVNNTPQSPPANCSKADHARAVRALAAAFERAFLQRDSVSV